MGEKTTAKKESAASNAGTQSAPKAEKSTAAKTAAPAIKTDKGVDLANKTIRIGVLNAESGPVAVVGKPFGIGKQILAAQINAGGSGAFTRGVED